MEDRRRLATGDLTAVELQERNSQFRWELVHLDKTPSYS
jgi:hypothetical protein